MGVLFVAGASSLAIGVCVYLMARRFGPSPRGAVAVEVGERLQETGLRRLLRTRMTPGVASGLVLTVTVAAVVLTGLLVGVLAYWIRRGAPFVSVDETIERWADGAATTGSDAVLVAVTQLGATVTVIAVGVAVALWARLRRGNWTAAAFLIVVLVGQSLIANLIKLAVARVRPDLDPRTAFSGTSFPSGHSTAAAASFLAFSLVLAYGKGPNARAAITSIAVGLAVAVAWSRVLLGVHWPSDVVAGLAIGWTWYGICAVVFGGRLMRYGVPAEVAEAAPSASARFEG